MGRKGKIVGLSALLATGLAVGALRDPIDTTPAPVDSVCEGTFASVSVHVTDVFVRARILAEDQAVQRKACRLAVAIGKALSESKDLTFIWSLPDRTGGELDLKATHTDSLGSTALGALFSAPHNLGKGGIIQAGVEHISPEGKFIHSIGLYRRPHSGDSGLDSWTVHEDTAEYPYGSWISDSISGVHTFDELQGWQARADQVFDSLATVHLPAY